MFQALRGAESCGRLPGIRAKARTANFTGRGPHSELAGLLRGGEGGIPMGEHWFWGTLTVVCLLWYSTMTIYVAIRGASDIQTMLKNLAQLRQDKPNGV
jgi:hypothetical protein